MQDRRPLSILAVSPRIPYPLLDGGRKAIYFQLEALARRGHHVRLFCLGSEDEDADIGPLEAFAEVSVVSHDKTPRIAGGLGSLPDARPYVLSRFHVDTLLSRLVSLAPDYDVLHCEMLHTAWYGLQVKRHYPLPIIMRLHNIESHIMTRWSSVQSNPLMRMAARFEAWKMARYEKMVYPRFDLITALSEHDLQQVITAAEHTREAMVVSPGVDPDFLSTHSPASETDRVLWLGALSWPPNVEGLTWFCRNVLPRIVEHHPSVKVDIVGSSPPSEVFDLAGPNVNVIGEVPDIRPYVRESGVCVIPLRVGGGVRFKILELLAMQKALVTTSIGCEGLGLVDEEHLLIRDDPEGFSQAITSLLTDDRRRTDLGRRGRQLVCDRYSWESSTLQYENALYDLVSQHGGTG